MEDWRDTLILLCSIKEHEQQIPLIDSLYSEAFSHILDYLGDSPTSLFVFERQGGLDETDFVCYLQYLIAVSAFTPNEAWFRLQYSKCISSFIRSTCPTNRKYKLELKSRDICIIQRSWGNYAKDGHKENLDFSDTGKEGEAVFGYSLILSENGMRKLGVTETVYKLTGIRAGFFSSKQLYNSIWYNFTIPLY